MGSQYRSGCNSSFTILYLQTSSAIWAPLWVILQLSDCLATGTRMLFGCCWFATKHLQVVLAHRLSQEFLQYTLLYSMCIPCKPGIKSPMIEKTNLAEASGILVAMCLPCSISAQRWCLCAKRRTYPERLFYLTGHSLGGGVAKLVALSLGDVVPGGPGG